MMYDSKLKELHELMSLRGFTHKTKKTYSYCVSKYLQFIVKSKLSPTNISAKQYLLYLNSKKYDTNTIRLSSAAILFFLKEILKQNVSFIEIPKPKKKKLLPKVLSKEEIKLMINSTKNKKHKLIISLLYSSGLRLSELQNLKRENIDPNRNVIFVKQGKGKKDRITILSQKIKTEILDYICNSTYKSKYLIEGRQGRKYSSESIQKVIKLAGEKAKISRTITPHMLRHSFATHLLEDGVDIRYIQRLLGHQNLETTTIYTQVANNKLENIVSPLDKL